MPWNRVDQRPPMPEMTTAKWMQILPAPVLISDLVLTQDGVHFHGITHGTSESGDPYPHVYYNGEDYYLIDGHHRLIRHLIDSSNAQIWVRILRDND